MAKEYRWEIMVDGKNATVVCVLQGNKYRLFLNDDHISDIYRLPPKKMHYGLVEDIRIGNERCRFVVWEEIPDLVVDGKLVSRGVDFETARENRRRNMENMYTATAVFGVVALFAAFLFVTLGFLTMENIHVFTSLLMAGIGMVGMGLYYRGKWIEQIP